MRCLCLDLFAPAHKNTTFSLTSSFLSSRLLIFKSFNDVLHVQNLGLGKTCLKPFRQSVKPQPAAFAGTIQNFFSDQSFRVISDLFVCSKM
jgi:hypothetical protein